MKKWFLNFTILLLSVSSFAQVDSTTPPYKKYPTLPPFDILLGDSTTRYTKTNLPASKPVFIMLFSPDCNHCQHEAEELLAYKDDLKNIQIVMVTMHPLWQMNEFVNTYRLKEVPNIVIGKDLYYTLPGFYNIRNLPFHALYDKKGNLISVFEGSTDVKKILQHFEKE